VLKRTKTPHGEVLYVPGQHCAARLDEVFDGQWSFTIIWEPVVGNDYVMVSGRLVAGGETRDAVGSQKITIRKETGEVVDQANDIRKAAANAFKRCCRMLGIGRYLITGAQPRSGQSRSGKAQDATQRPRSPAPPQSRGANPSQPGGPDTARGGGNSSGANEEQQDRIRYLALSRLGGTKAQLEQRCRQRYRCGTKELSSRQAADFIAALEKLVDDKECPAPQG